MYNILDYHVSDGLPYLFWFIIHYHNNTFPSRLIFSDQYKVIVCNLWNSF